MSEYEEFISYYELSNVWKCARKDYRQYVASGYFWFFVISLFSFCLLSIGSIIKTGWISLLLFILGIPFTISWMIYVSKNPSMSSMRIKIDNYINNKREIGEFANFCNYVSVQYVFSDSSPRWKNGYGMALPSLVFGQIIGNFGELVSLHVEKIDSAKIQISILVAVLLFMFDNIFPGRKTRVHWAIQDIKKNDNNHRRNRHSKGNL